MCWAVIGASVLLLLLAVVVLWALVVEVNKDMEGY